jgi:hypothetical protein
MEQIDQHMVQYLAPTMPTVSSDKPNHREKLCVRAIPFNLIVARPVGRQQMTDNPTAQAAMQKEWRTLKTQGMESAACQRRV